MSGVKRASESENTKSKRPDRRSDNVQVHSGSYASEQKLSNPNKQFVIKRRCALWIAYCGNAYSGMQMNEGVKTIEAELESALFKAGNISQSNFGFLQKIGWSRAARTDKGVHAIGQVVSAKLMFQKGNFENDEIAEVIRCVNDQLPEDIRLLDVIGVTRNFNAKLGCDQRTYAYVLPSFMLASTLLRDIPTLEWQTSYRMSNEEYERVNTVAKLFVGTHNFHNFTSRLQPKNDKCKRYITSFEAERPSLMGGSDVEWIRLVVTGQSFLLNQIRKMIGMIVEVCSNRIGEDAIERAFGLDKMDLAKAPALGLYLVQAHFEHYNRKLSSFTPKQGDGNRVHPKLEFCRNPEITKVANAFQKDIIEAFIVSEDAKNAIYSTWRQYLESKPLKYDSIKYEDWKKEKGAQALLNKET